MLDIQFFRRLSKSYAPDRLEPAGLIAELREAAALPLQERTPTLGFVPKLARHPDAGVRAAAVSLLAGAAAPAAHRLVVAALDDPAAEVRLAAVEALRETAQNVDPARWAHVIFHPDPAVRRAGLEDPARFPMGHWQALYLLADPDNADLARAIVDQSPLPGGMFPVILHLIHIGAIVGDEARRRMTSVPRDEVLKIFETAPRRGAEQLAEMNRQTGPAGSRDGFLSAAGEYPADDWLMPFADAPDEPSAGWLIGLMGQLLGTPSADEFAGAALAAALRSGATDRPDAGADFQPPRFHLLAFAGVMWPGLLICPWLPIRARREALGTWYEVGRGLPELPAEFVRRIVDSELCRLPGGEPDLWAVGAALHRHGPNGLREAAAWLGADSLRAGFEAAPERATWLLRLPHASAKARRELLRELLLIPRFRRAEFLARVARSVPADGLDFFDVMRPEDVPEVFARLWPTLDPVTTRKRRALADLFAAKVLAGRIGPFLTGWLGDDPNGESELGLAILARLARHEDGRLLIQAVRSLEPTLKPALTRAVTHSAGFPHHREADVAEALANHTDPGIRAWVAARRGPTVAASGRPRFVAKAGLCAELRLRPGPAGPDLAVCVNLLGCHDPLDEVDAELVRFGSDDPDFVRRLDEGAAEAWVRERELPTAGHAWLYRWDDHLERFAGSIDDVATALAALAGLRSVLRQRCWQAIARLTETWRWHDPDRLAAARSMALAEVLRSRLAGDLGPVAASLFARWHQAEPDHPALAAVRDDVLLTLADCPESVRLPLRAWIDTRGMADPESDTELEPERPAEGPKRAPRADNRGRLKRVRASTDLDELAEALTTAPSNVAVVALLRMVEFGEAGTARVFDAFHDRGYPNTLDTVFVMAVRKHPDGPFGTALAGWLRRPEVPSQRRSSVLAGLLASRALPVGTRDLYREIASAFVADASADLESRLKVVAVARIDGGLTPETALELVMSPSAAGGMTRTVAERLWDMIVPAGGPGMIARLMACPYAWLGDRAAQQITREPDQFPAAMMREALESYLEQGTKRPRALRLMVATLLHNRFRSPHAVPILLQQVSIPSSLDCQDLLVTQSGEVIRAATTGLLLQGNTFADEMLVTLLAAEGVDRFEREDAYARVIEESVSPAARKRAREQVRAGYSRSNKLRRVSETFAWGVRAGRQLTGKLFTVEMTPGEELGFTRFGQDKIYITPLPILRNEFHAQEVVRALILHEYGHHMYHYGPGAREVWSRAEQNHLHQLLNLVSDEHLERNLRALDRGFGDQLKQLAAYAFQHTAREIGVDPLLASLGGRAFEVLTSIPLAAARRFGCVAVNNGRLLSQMERSGLSFARFVRALRMGLGDRHGDPKVRRGLDLFQGKFRKSSMDDLYEIAEELRRIFGWETDLLQSFSQDVSLSADGEELDCVGDGITNEEVQGRVRATLQGKQKRDDLGSGTGGHGLNLGPEEDFYTITKVVPIAHDPKQHAELARRVRRPAERMRRFFRQMGLSLRPTRFRLRGRAFDRTRARAVVLRGDPRMLIARETMIHTDLFLGVVVDCSGSMSYGDRMDRARLFGTLLAEAAAGQPGVDVRVFGFTDKLIYDAGSGERCAAHGLNAGGGNNDAAGLWHAAQAARASSRKAKLLVMISDGAPTECTVAALRGLVSRLTHRWKMVCAQVAVCPLNEICFPHYFLIDGPEVEGVVEQFGQVMARLVTKALRGG